MWITGHTVIPNTKEERMNVQRNTLLGRRPSGAASWRITIFCCVLCTCYLAHADSTWDGSEGGDWFDMDNWSAGIPDSADIAFIPGDGTFPVISGSGNDAEAQRILVGYNTLAILYLTNGASLTTTQSFNQPSYLGYNAPGYVYLDGSGSVWNVQGGTPSNDAAIRVGYQDTSETRGRIKVENGAHVSIAGGAGISLWSWDLGSGNYLRSVIYIGASGGAETGAGTLDAGWIEGDSGATADSELRFNHNNSDYYFTSDGTSSGSAVQVRGQITVYHNGHGTTHLTGANTYSNGTSIGDGTLAVSDNENLGDNAGPISFISPTETGTFYAVSSFTNEHAIVVSDSHGVIKVDSGQMFTQNAPISGDKALTKTGAGTFVHAASNTLSGTTTISEGTLQLGDGTSGDGDLGTGTVIIEAGAFLAFNHDGGPQPRSIVNNLSGEGNVSISGTNGYAFYGSNTYSGTTTIGTNNYLSLKHTNSIGTGDIAVNGTLYLETATNMTLNNTLTGTGTVYVGSGTKLTHTNDSSFGGRVEIGNGTLQLGNGGTNGRFNVGPIVLQDGNLIINRSDTFTFPNEVTEQGTIVVDGGGDVTFTGIGSSYYSFVEFIVSNGTLRLADGVENVYRVEVMDGSLLDATVEGEIYEVVVANGGILSPEDSPPDGDLDIDKLRLNSSSRMVFELGAPNDDTNDYIYVSEVLELDGFVDVVARDGFGAGEYIIVGFEEAFSVTNNGIQMGNVPSGYEGSLIFDEEDEWLILVVTELPSGLETFRSTYGLNPDGSDDLLDWSTNGVENIAYYFFGLGDPNTVPLFHTDPDTITPGLPIIELNGETNPVVFAYTRLVDPEADGITFNPQAATNVLDATPWNDISSLTGNRAPSGTNTIPVDLYYEIIELEFPLSIPSPSLFRVRVTFNE